MKTKYLPTYVSLYNMTFVFVVFQESFALVYLPRLTHRGAGGGKYFMWKGQGCSPENV